MASSEPECKPLRSARSIPIAGKFSGAALDEPDTDAEIIRHYREVARAAAGGLAMHSGDEKSDFRLTQGFDRQQMIDHAA